ncbi:MAG: PP2C family protein-serine/threonine phosphatase [Metamycoplasmataceae bacterium]
MEFGTKSNVGNYRKENQDRVDIFHNQHFHFLILCDGMGGHYGGSLASSTTISTFRKEFLGKNFPIDSDNFEDYTFWFKQTIKKCIDEMIKKANGDEAKLDMGTTVTCALVNTKAKILTIFNIGDSRTFILSTDGELKQVTKDQNLLNNLIAEGMNEREAKLAAPNWAALVSALGPYKRRKIAVFNIEKKWYERIYAIITTCDGIHDFVRIPTMEAILNKRNTIGENLEILINEALDNKSTDNVTAGMIVLDNKKNLEG